MLGVTSDATPTEIKVAYRTLVRKLHPDVSSNPQDTEKFKELKDVYEILIDPEKRKKYDILYSYYISKNYHNREETPEVKPEPEKNKDESNFKEDEIKEAQPDKPKD